MEGIIIRFEEIIYLAGPINQCSDKEATGWREEFKTVFARKIKPYAHIFDVFILDPMRRDYREDQKPFYQTGHVNDSYHRTYVHFDKRDIELSTILVAYMPKISFGTTCEVFMAYEMGKYVVIISEDVLIRMHGWVIDHSHYRSSDRDEAIDHLVDTIVRNYTDIMRI